MESNQTGTMPSKHYLQVAILRSFMLTMQLGFPRQPFLMHRTSKQGKFTLSNRWVRICTSHSLHSCERLPAYYRPTIIKPYTLTIPILSPHTPILCPQWLCGILMSLLTTHGLKPTTVFRKNRAIINRLNPHEPCDGS